MFERELLISYLDDEILVRRPRSHTKTRYRYMDTDSCEYIYLHVSIYIYIYLQIDVMVVIEGGLYVRGMWEGMGGAQKQHLCVQCISLVSHSYVGIPLGIMV